MCIEHLVFQAQECTANLSIQAEVVGRVVVAVPKV